MSRLAELDREVAALDRSRARLHQEELAVDALIQTVRRQLGAPLADQLEAAHDRAMYAQSQYEEQLNRAWTKAHEDDGK